jgi:uridine kinase
MRDQVERGYTEDMILYQWYNHVMPAYDAYLLPYKPYCEFVIHNNDDITNEINILSNYLRQKI